MAGAEVQRHTPAARGREAFPATLGHDDETEISPVPNSDMLHRSTTSPCEQSLGHGAQAPRPPYFFCAGAQLPGRRRRRPWRQALSHLGAMWSQMQE